MKRYRCMKVQWYMCVCVEVFGSNSREDAVQTCGKHEWGEVAGPHVGAGTGQVHVHALHLQQLPRHLPPGLAIKTHPKKTTQTNPKKPSKNPLKMFFLGFFGFLKFLIFYENNTNFSLWNRFEQNK
jgi:hypothetical protein